MTRMPLIATIASFSAICVHLTHIDAPVFILLWILLWSGGDRMLLVFGVPMVALALAAIAPARGVSMVLTLVGYLGLVGVFTALVIDDDLGGMLSLITGLPFLACTAYGLWQLLRASLLKAFPPA